MVAISAAIQPPKPRPTSAGVLDLQLREQAAIDTAMSRTLLIHSGRGERL
jgi:hypothetical protein